MAYNHTYLSDLLPQWPTATLIYIHFSLSPHTGLKTHWSAWPATILACSINGPKLQCVTVTLQYIHAGLQHKTNTHNQTYPHSQWPTATPVFIHCDLQPHMSPFTMAFSHPPSSTFPVAYTHTGPYPQWPTATLVNIHSGLQPHRSTFKGARALQPHRSTFTVPTTTMAY